MLPDKLQNTQEYQVFLMASKVRHINMERPAELALAIYNTSDANTKGNTSKKKNCK